MVKFAKINSGQAKLMQFPSVFHLCIASRAKMANRPVLRDFGTFENDWVELMV